jgi:hypothetical protein
MFRAELSYEPRVDFFADDMGRRFNFIHVSRPKTKKLVIHFTAFFGDWGERKEYRENYQGYFHRLKMLKDVTDYGFLFLCDQFGVEKNGTYYTGEKGDFFVERAVINIIQQALLRDGISEENVITIGSSSGATAALKFGLIFGVRGIVAICPHIDLDTSAALQGRSAHVAFIVPDGDPLSSLNRAYTRQVSNAVADRDVTRHPLPRVFMQTCTDDHGVYSEQVVPFVDLWHKKGGLVDLDVRSFGGHTSEYATKAVILDVLQKLFSGDKVDTRDYATRRRYRAESRRSFYSKLIDISKALGVHRKRP